MSRRGNLWYQETVRTRMRKLKNRDCHGPLRGLAMTNHRGPYIVTGHFVALAMTVPSGHPSPLRHCEEPIPSNYVIARSPYFGRRGNLWCQETVRTRIRNPKNRDCHGPLRGLAMTNHGGPYIVTGHFVALAMTRSGSGPRDDRKRKERVFAMTKTKNSLIITKKPMKLGQLKHKKMGPTLESGTPILLQTVNIPSMPF